MGQDLCLVLLTKVMTDCSFLASNLSSFPINECISTHCKFKKELGIHLCYGLYGLGRLLSIFYLRGCDNL